MSFVVTLEGLVPERRYDGFPWTQARIEESAAESGPWTPVETITLTPADADPTKPVARNLTTALAALPSGSYRVVWRDAASHELATGPIDRTVGLISLERLKRSLDIPASSTAKDQRLLEIIQSVSRMILNYTDRDFGSPSVTETRTYPYDGYGIVDIDDATAVTVVTITYPAAVPYVLNNLDWYAEPLIKPQGVYEWLVVPPGAPYGGPSPEMGFKQNMDTYVPLLTQPTTVAVTGTFGWPEVPPDVVEAAELIARDLHDRPSGDLQSHSIESFSESFADPRGFQPTAIPAKAKDILDMYRRIPLNG